jgi:hypothetical protein
LFLGLLAACLSLAYLVLTSDSFDAGATQYEILQSIPFGVKAILLAIKLVASLWIAIAWHRFTLQKTLPDTHLPQWPGIDALGRYFILLSLLALLTIAAAIPVFLVLQFLYYMYWVFATASPLPEFEPTPFQFVALSLFPVMFLLFRYALVLPASVLKQELSLHASWKATKYMTHRMFAVPTCVGLGFLAYIVLGTSIVADWWMIAVSTISYVVLLILSVGIVSGVYQHLVKEE